MVLYCPLNLFSMILVYCDGTQPATTTRKSAFQGDRQNSETSYYADDEDANQKKYTRRGEHISLFLYCFFCG